MEVVVEGKLAEFWGRVGRGGAEEIDGLLLPPAITGLLGCSDTTTSPLGEVIPLSLPPLVVPVELFKLEGLEPRLLFPFLALLLLLLMVLLIPVAAVVTEAPEGTVE